MFARISLRVLSCVFDAAVIKVSKKFTILEGIPQLTLFGNNGDHGILVDIFHGLHASFIDRRYNIDTTDTPLAICRRVQQRGLEVRIQFGIKLAIVTKEHPNRLISVNACDFEVGAEGVLNKVAVIGRNLKTIGASNFHQSLVSRFASDGMRQLFSQLGEIAWGMEIRVEEGLASGEARDMSCELGQISSYTTP